MFWWLLLVWFLVVFIVATLMLLSRKPEKTYGLRDSNFFQNGARRSVSVFPGPMEARWVPGNDVVTDAHIGEPAKAAWLIEPESVTPKPYASLRQGHDYQVVLTHQRQSGIPRAVWVPNAMAHVDTKYWHTQHVKTGGICAFVSAKNYTEGHRRRKQIPERIGKLDVDFYGAYHNRHVADKGAVLSQYQYCVVVENSSVSGYFSEKLIDCFLVGTVPLRYWGDPDIGLVFDLDGFMDRPGPLTSRVRAAMQRNHEIARRLTNENDVFRALARNL